MRIASIAYVNGLSRATTAIHVGMASTGTNALLMKTSGSVTKPVMAKNVPCVGTR